MVDSRADDEPSGVVLSGILDRLTRLEDLFRRRLVEDKDKRRAFDVLYERLEKADSALQGEMILPLVRQLLLVVDRIDAYEGDDQFVVSLCHELLEILRRSGIEEIQVGREFDPALHEAVEVVDHDGAGSVLDVRRRGFWMGDHVLRPVHVLVVGGSSTAAATPQGELDDA